MEETEFEKMHRGMKPNNTLLRLKDTTGFRTWIKQEGHNQKKRIRTGTGGESKTRTRAEAKAKQEQEKEKDKDK